MVKLRTHLFAVLLATIWVGTATAQLTHQWTNGTSNGLWSTNGNWIIKETGAPVTTPPNSSSKVLIAGPIAPALINHNAGTVREMVVGSNGLDGAFRMASGSLVVSYPVDIGVGGGADGTVTLDNGTLDVEMVRVGKLNGGVSRLIVNGGVLKTRRVATLQGGLNDPAIYLTSALASYGGSTGDALMEVHGGIVEVEGQEPTAGNFNSGKWDIDLKASQGNAQLLVTGGTVYARSIDLRNTGESSASFTSQGGAVRADRIRAGIGQSNIIIRNNASVKLGRNFELGSGSTLTIEGSGAEIYSARPLLALWADTGCTINFVAGAGGFSTFTSPGFLSIGTGVTLNVDARALGIGQYELFSFSGGSSDTNNHGNDFVPGLLQFAPGLTGEIQYGPHSIVLSVQSAAATVLGGYVFHNAWTGPSSSVWSPIDTTKQLARKGSLPQALSLTNVINSSHGINAIVLDFQGVPDPSQLTLGDFEFRMSPQGGFQETENPPSQWSPAPGTTAMSVSEMPGSITRVFFQWPNNVIKTRWLRILARDTSQTGLTAPETFYVGHLLGEATGVEAGLYSVSVQDLLTIRPKLGQNVDAGEPADIDKNGLIQVADIIAMRPALATQLRNITIP